MRLIAKVNQTNSKTKRLMIYNSDDGVYLFGYKALEDSHANWDEWFENITEAIELSEEKYNVKSTEWQQIPDPLENCQHDWINPVRVKDRSSEKLGLRTFEKLENGNWVSLS